MTIKEFRLSVLDSELKDEWLSMEIPLKLPFDGFEHTFKGIVSFYEFISRNKSGWDRIVKTNGTNKNFAKCHEFFSKLKAKTLTYTTSYSVNSFLSSMDQTISYDFSRIRIYRYDAPEIKFLIKLDKEHPNYFDGAWDFLGDSFQSSNKEKKYWIGSLMAYEFLTKDSSLIVSRKNAEKPSLTSLRKQYQIHLSEANDHLMEYLEKSKSNYQDNVKIIDKLKDDKEKHFDEWFEGSKELFSSFDETSNKKVADLEELYSSKLMLEKPADYWANRANELKIEGAKWMKYLLWSTGIGAGLLFVLLIVIASNKFEEIFSFSGKTIRWSILFITMMSLIAFLVRTFTKLTFSTYHLVRDSEERKQLTYVYLALLENKAVGENERQIILQSLFSRADTGLLKDDSSPTMPSSSTIEKSFRNQN